MSHLKERKEKNCLNCNAEVGGRFCHICGQENIEPKESVLHLLNHYFQDITHFDGKFFSSLKYLVTKPGFLSSEYIRGRRASYLNPIRMYVFSSALFFLVFFLVVKFDVKDASDNVPATSARIVEKLNSKIQAIEAIKQVAGDSFKIKRLNERINQYNAQLSLLQRDSIAGKKKYYDEKEAISFVSSSGESYNNMAEYDSVQLHLPDAEKDHFFKRKLLRKSLEIKGKYKGQDNTLLEKLMDHFMHKFPQILFISLPLFALILKLVYFRRKHFYYADHIIFTIHLYIFTFLLMLAMLMLQNLMDVTHWGILDLLILVLNLSLLIYQYKAMKNFYQQGRWKTVLKFFIVNMLAFFVMAVLSIGFFLFSFFQT